MVGDPLDLFFDREFVLRLPGLDDPAARGIPLELGDHELPLPPAGLERRDHLGAVEDDVAVAHVELRHDRFAEVQEQVVHRRQDKFPREGKPSFSNSRNRSRVSPMLYSKRVYAARASAEVTPRLRMIRRRTSRRASSRPIFRSGTRRYRLSASRVT